jgi:hypothetical protein
MGVKVFIHNQAYTPTFYDGFYVAVDAETDVTVSRTNIKRMEAPYGECVKDIQNYGSVFTNVLGKLSLSKISVYKQAYCFDYCFQRNVTLICGCKINIEIYI